MTRGRRGTIAAGAIAAAGLLLVACGEGEDAAGAQSDGGSAESGPEAGPDDADQLKPGPDIALCGGVDDEELVQDTRIRSRLDVVRDPVGCQWDAGSLTGGDHASFTWYRGSPVGREKAIDDAVGREVQDERIEGQPGFVSSMGERLCEVGVQYDGDFFLWSVAYDESPSVAPPRDACDAARELAGKTARRTG